MGWGSLCQAVTSQRPLGLSKSSLKITDADLFPSRCLDILLLGQQESVLVFQLDCVRSY